MQKPNSLAKNFTFSSLLLFALPNIVMMIVMSTYTIVDGIFVSMFVGTNGLSAVNLWLPVIGIEMAIGIMLATGGSAIVARKLGEKKEIEASQNFTLLAIAALIMGILISVFGSIFIDQILKLLGVSDVLFEYCHTYGSILLYFAPAFLIQCLFQSFFVTAGKPAMGLALIVGSGLTNMILDYVFIVPLNMGITGAALATGIGYCVPTIVGTIYFLVSKSSVLSFVKPRFDRNVLVKSCSNGSSEMVTNLGLAITTYLFNVMFLKYYGENGVASITIILYFQFVFSAIYTGYSMGVAPIISYNYGCGNTQQLKRIFKISMTFLTICSIITFFSSRLIANNVIQLFTAKGTDVYELTSYGFILFSFSFLMMGYNIFASAMFTAFSDGKVSALLSFSRTFLFLAGGLLILPTIWGTTGIWIAVPIAESLGLVVSLVFLLKKHKIYNYA